MKNLFVIAIITSLLGACSNSSKQPLDDPGFAALMDSNVEKIIKNPNYRRIPIETDAQERDYLALYYKAYQKKITKNEFIQQMNAKYPGYSESVQWNADQLPD